MLGRKEREQREALVLAALEQAGDWMTAYRLARAVGLTYDTLKPPLEALRQAGLIERESASRLARWGLASKRVQDQAQQAQDQAPRAQERAQERANRAREELERGWAEAERRPTPLGVEALDEHALWLQKVRLQRMWRKQKVLREQSPRNHP